MPVWVWLAAGGGALFWWWKTQREAPEPPPPSPAEPPPEYEEEPMVRAGEPFDVVRVAGPADHLSPLCNKLLAISERLMPFLPPSPRPKTWTAKQADMLLGDLVARLNECFGKRAWLGEVFDPDLTIMLSRPYTQKEMMLTAFIRWFSTPTGVLSDFVMCMKATIEAETPTTNGFRPARQRLYLR